MILQALNRYYDLITAQPPGDGEGLSFPPLWFANQGVSYAFRLNWDGAVTDILSVKEERRTAKKNGDKVDYFPQTMVLPMPEVRAVNIQANFLWDNATYLLGLDKGKPERAKECFEAARSLHESLLGNVDTPAARAVLGFFAQYGPDKLPRDLLDNAEMLEEARNGKNFVFLLPDGSYAHDHDELKSAWVNFKSTEPGIYMQCLVTGKENSRIARLHPKVKGVKDAQGVGANLVSYNARAYESYGLEGNANGPVGVKAAFAYTTVLNALLASRDNRKIMEGSTIVYWAESPNPEYAREFGLMAFEPENQSSLLNSIMKSAARGEAILADGLDPETPFCILALAPNAARLSVRFFLKDTFGNIIDNIKAHYERLEIARAPYEKEYLSPQDLLRETVFPGSKDDASSPLLAGAFTSAILGNSPYPVSLMQNVLGRVHAEHEINRAKAAILKAFLTKNRGDDPRCKEAATVSLNEKNSDIPYVLGRLFAVLEFTQKNSADAAIGANIQKKFFSSACDTPALVFPQLIERNAIYLNRMSSEKTRTFYSKLAGELIDRLPDRHPFPASLSNDEQGQYLVGYHHQVQAFYQKKTADALAGAPQDEGEPTEREDA